MESQRPLGPEKINKYIPATGTGKDYIWLPMTYEPIARVDFTLTDTDNGNVLRNSKSSPNVHLDWSLDGTSGPFVVERSTSFSFSNPEFLGPAQSEKSFDDGVLTNGTNYAYRIFRRTLTDTLYFYHADHLGTPIAMTNGAGTLVWRAEHTPFGGIYAMPVSTVQNNLRFTGQYFDGETGLAQNWFREYEEKTGRYIEPEPSDLMKLVYTYPYSNDSPLIIYDRDARSAIVIVAVVGIIVMMGIIVTAEILAEGHEMEKKNRECAPCHGYVPRKPHKRKPGEPLHLIITSRYHKTPPRESPWICLPKPEPKHVEANPPEVRDPSTMPAWPSETVEPAP